MTSCERQDPSEYNGVREPDYWVLSYTWGRFQAEAGSTAIRIHNLQWDIPPIKPEHFSVDELQGVMSWIGKRADFLWIDIACIDQLDRARQMYEIGRQAAIFNCATLACIWMTRLGHREMQNAVSALMDGELVGLCTRGTSKRTDEEDIRLLRNVVFGLETLSRDPWFSSLWTLQELVIRPDAVLLSREGVPSTATVGDLTFNVRVEDLTNMCQHLVVDLEERAHGCAPEVIELSKRVVELLLPTGFDCSRYISNPNYAYSLAQHRTTLRPLDRVYGIMQLYGFKLGESRLLLSSDVTSTPAQPPPSLEDLEDELAASLVHSLPRTSQLFIHTRTPRLGRSWSISQSCKVPIHFQGSLEGSKDLETHAFPFEARVRDEKPPVLSVKARSVSLRHLKYLCGPSEDKSHIPPDRGSFLYFDTNKVVRDEFMAVNGKELPILHKIEPESWRASSAVEILDKHTDTGDLRVIWLGNNPSNIYGLVVYRPFHDRPFIRIGLICIGECIANNPQQWTTGWESFNAKVR